MAKRIIVLILTLAVIAGLICGGVFLFKSCNSDESDKLEYKPSYLGGEYFARNNVNADKTLMEFTEKALDTGYTFTFTVKDVAGYNVKSVKCNAVGAVIDVDAEKNVTVTIATDALDKETFSVMIIYDEIK